MPMLGNFCTRSLVGWTVDGVLSPLSWLPGPPVAPTAAGYFLLSINLLAQGMPACGAPEGEWEAYRQSRFTFEPYETGRELFFKDEAERVAE